MGSGATTIPKTLLVPPSEDYSKVANINFRSGFGFVENISIECDHPSAAYIEVGVKIGQVPDITDLPFNFGPVKLAPGVVDLDFKNPKKIIMGNLMDFYVKNTSGEEIEITIFSEIRYEQF